MIERPRTYTSELLDARAEIRAKDEELEVLKEKLSKKDEEIEDLKVRIQNLREQLVLTSSPIDFYV